MTPAIHRQLLTVLDEATGLESLLLHQDIILVPEFQPYTGAKDVQIQVQPGPTRVVDRDGSVRREDFTTYVGLIFEHDFERHGRQHRVLYQQVNNLADKREELIAALDANFLPTTAGDASTNLLVRPLIYYSFSEPKVLGRESTSLGYILTFTGGINVGLT